MTIRTFLTGIAAGTVACLSVWLVIIFFTSPYESGWIILALFYFSLFLWLSGIFILGGFFVRYFLRPKAMPYAILSIAVRQAIIGAIVVNIFLIMKGLKVLGWINGLFLFAAAIFIESYFLSNNNEQRSHRNREN